MGSGVTGVEFVHLFRSCGAKVTLIERAANLLPSEDEDVGRTLERALRRHGVKTIVGSRLIDVARRPDGIELRLVRGSGDSASPVIEAWYPGRPDLIAEIRCDAAGRMPATNVPVELGDQN